MQIISICQHKRNTGVPLNLPEIHSAAEECAATMLWWLMSLWSQAFEEIVEWQPGKHVICICKVYVTKVPKQRIGNYFNCNDWDTHCFAVWTRDRAIGGQPSHLKSISHTYVKSIHNSKTIRCLQLLCSGSNIICRIHGGPYAVSYFLVSFTHLHLCTKQNNKFSFNSFIIYACKYKIRHPSNRFSTWQ